MLWKHYLTTALLVSHIFLLWKKQKACFTKCLNSFAKDQKGSQSSDMLQRGPLVCSCMRKMRKREMEGWSCQGEWLKRKKRCWTHWEKYYWLETDVFKCFWWKFPSSTNLGLLFCFSFVMEGDPTICDILFLTSLVLTEPF